MIIDKFDGEYAFLSNFYPSPITDGNIIFPTVEHFFQAAKTVNMADYEMIAAADTPGRAKRLGRRIELREDWEEVKDGIMLEALRRKFSDDFLRRKLIATGDAELIEGNDWNDMYWGVCAGVGRNKLGKLLMQVRNEFKNAEKEKS